MTAKPGSTPATESEEPSSRVPRWGVVLAAVALAVVIIMIFYGYLARPGWIGVADKTFWDYLELLIVPAALAIGVYLLNRAQSEREREAAEGQQRHERKAEEDRREREHKAEAAQRKRELEVENQRAQDDALEAYLDDMTHLMIDHHLRAPLQGEARADVQDVSEVARARTLTLLRRLDSERKGHVVQFLYESGLILNDTLAVDLGQTDGRPEHGADLSGANLSGADLRNANLSGVNLRKANMRGAWLYDPRVQGPVSETGANLSGADLSGADLLHALVDEEQLKEATNLERVTMPDGTKL